MRNEIIKFVKMFLMLIKAWEWYKNAMGRKRPHSVLRKSQFVLHGLFHSHVKDCGKNGIILYQDYGTFKVPSHFAPTSLRNGVEMMRELLILGEYVLFIPEDLMLMAKKIGYKVLPITVPAEFRGEIMKKFICVPSKEMGSVVMKELVKARLSGLTMNDISLIPNSEFSNPKFHELFWDMWNSHIYAEDILEELVSCKIDTKKYSRVPDEYMDECLDYEEDNLDINIDDLIS